jgi:BRCT domain type II-containing protein
VVVGADPGSKFDQAKSLGVTILDEGQFDALLEGTLAGATAPAKTKPSGGKSQPRKSRRGKPSKSSHEPKLF